MEIKQQVKIKPVVKINFMRMTVIKNHVRQKAISLVYSKADC